MADIRYLVLSDLHFGEVNSVLTDLSEDQESDDPMIRPPFLDLNPAGLRLIEVVRRIAESTDGSVKPTLVLNGDIFELALAPRARAFDVFDQFIERLMPDEDHPFDNTIIYLPGNHDHDLWDTVRDEIDAHNIESRPADGRMPGSVPITAMLGHLDDEHPLKDLGHIPEVESGLLTRLIRHRNPHLGNVRVRVAYPNLGLIAGERMAIIHHGHFLEPTYVLMTELANRVFDAEPQTVTTWDLEIDNGPWLNFLWSSLGREGPVGDSIRRSYDMLNTDVGRVLLAERMASAMVGSDKDRRARARRWALRTLVLRAMARIKDSQLRHDSPLKPSVDEGLGTYLEGPVAAHLWYELTQRDLPTPKEVTFVFGHTHQPFTARRPISTLETELRLLNTGGWVVDTPAPQHEKGAGIVVLDDDLDAVLVRMYNRDEVPASVVTAVDHPDGPDVDSPLRDHIGKVMQDDPELWEELRRELGDAVARRRAEHSDRLQGELDALTESTRFGLLTDRVIRQLQVAQHEASRRVLLSERAAAVFRNLHPEKLRIRQTHPTPEDDARP